MEKILIVILEARDIKSCEVHYNEILLDKNEMYKGVLTENYVACEFYPKFNELFYYNFNKYEIDFLIKIDGNIIPVEVKSGRRK